MREVFPLIVHELHGFLTQLNLVNSQYCDLQDTLFSQKPGEQGDYSHMLSELLRIQTLLENYNANMKLQRSEIESHHEYSDLLTLMDRYQMNRERSMAKFRSILRGLKQRSDGHLFSYSLLAYNRDVTIQQKYEKEALEIGDSLQIQFDLLFPADGVDKPDGSLHSDILYAIKVTTDVTNQFTALMEVFLNLRPGERPDFSLQIDALSKLSGQLTGAIGIVEHSDDVLQEHQRFRDSFLDVLHKRNECISYSIDLMEYLSALKVGIPSKDNYIYKAKVNELLQLDKQAVERGDEFRAEFAKVLGKE